MTRELSPLRVLGLIAALVFTMSACGSESVGLLAGADGWEDVYQDGARQPWIYALGANFIVDAGELRLSGSETDPSGQITYAVFDASGISPIEGIDKRLSLGANEARLVESLGVEHHPSIFESDSAELYVMIRKSDLDEETRAKLDADLHVVAAFTLGPAGKVDFIGPFRDELNSEFDEAFKVAGSDGQSEFSFLQELALEIEETRGVTRTAPGRILEALEAGRQLMMDPVEVWKRTPPEDRSLDPEVAPPEVLASLTWTRFFVEVLAPAPGSVLKISTTEGVVSQVALDGFSGAFDALAVPGAPWEVSIVNSSGAVVDSVVVPASDWSGEVAMKASTDGRKVTTSSVSREELDRLNAASLVPAETGVDEPKEVPRG